MDTERKRHARRIFMDVADLPAIEREAAVKEACGVEGELRAEVEALLAAHDQAGGFMGSPTGIVTHDAGRVPRTVSGAVSGQREGDMIARYKLLQAIGEGGFGVVWMAEQREPVKRRVALKVIKLGMDTKQVIARFEAERQALAMMDHPNIAKVLDAGSTEAGRPYFVMEYIRGIPIIAYCDNERLDPRARLDLFAKVCNAIQHAHQKGVIHRDIKPSNVLVALHDGVPVPKVIDFGIAKATGVELTQKTLFTEHRQLVGTPAYMSPEQAEMSGLDVDTRSDIYSLGVLLYELLTGTTPFDTRELLNAGYAEMMRIIREVEPARPSTRLSTLGQTASRTAESRMARDPKALGSALRGDLDWIVMKCLEKDRARRYESASALAADVGRYLEDQPVAAGPPTAGYRLRKFVRRHRGQVAAAVVLLASLMVATIGLGIGMVQAKQAAAAERVAKDEAEGKRAEAERNLTFAKRGNEVLGSVFTALSPGARYATVGELRGALAENLDQAIENLDRAAIGDALEVAGMQHVLGLSLLGLGRADKALRVIERAAVARSTALGVDHADTLQARHDLATAYVFAGFVEKALPLEEETLRRLRAKDGVRRGQLLASMESLAYLYARSGRLAEARPLAEDSLRLAQSDDARGAVPPGAGDEVLAAQENLVLVYGMAGEHALALPVFEAIATAAEKEHGREHPATLRAKANLAIASSDAGDIGRAISLYQAVLPLQQESLGRDHPATLVTMGNLANAYERTGKPEQAALLYEETYKLRQLKLGPSHPETIGGLSHLADAYWRAGKTDLALPLLSEMVRLNREKFGPDHPDTLNGMLRLAYSYGKVGRSAEALPLYSEVVERRKATLGKAHVETLAAMCEFGAALVERGDFQQAEPVLLEAYREFAGQGQSLSPAARDRMCEVRSVLIRMYEAAGNGEEAARWRAVDCR